MKRWILCLCLGGQIWTLAPARAEPRQLDINSRAKAHLDRGIRLYMAGRYQEAAMELQAGYVQDPHPSFLYALGQTERKRGDCKKAIEYYNAFLKTSPPEQQGNAARKLVERCEETLNENRPSESERETPPAVAPPAAPTAPPVATPTALAPSRVDMDTSRRTPWYTDVWGDALVGSGVAVIGVGTWLFFSSSSDEEDAAKTAPDHQTYQAALEDAQTKRTLAIATLASGAALVAGGIIRYVLRKDEPRRPAQESLWLAPERYGLALGGRF